MLPAAFSQPPGAAEPARGKSRKPDPVVPARTSSSGAFAWFLFPLHVLSLARVLPVMPYSVLTEWQAHHRTALSSQPKQLIKAMDVVSAMDLPPFLVLARGPTETSVHMDGSLRTTRVWHMYFDAPQSYSKGSYHVEVGVRAECLMAAGVPAGVPLWTFRNVEYGTCGCDAWATTTCWLVMTALTVLYQFPRDGTPIPESKTARECAWRTPPSAAKRRLMLLLGDTTCVKAASVPFGPSERSFRLMDYAPSLLVGGRSAFNPLPFGDDFEPPPEESAAWGARRDAVLDAFAVSTVVDARGAPTTAIMYRLNPAEKNALLSAKYAELQRATAEEASARKASSAHTPATAKRSMRTLQWELPDRFERYIVWPEDGDDADDAGGVDDGSDGGSVDGGTNVRPLFQIQPALPMLQHGATYTVDEKKDALADAEADVAAGGTKLAQLESEATVRFLRDALDPARKIFCKFCGFVENADHFFETEGVDDGLVPACRAWEEEGADGDASRAQRWEREGASRRHKRDVIPNVSESLYSCNRGYWKANKNKAFMWQRRRSSGAFRGHSAAASAAAGQVGEDA